MTTTSPSAGAAVDPAGPIDSTDLLDEPVALRARLAEDGYLFCPGLLPAAEVHAVRRDVLALLAGRGWLDDGAPLEAGIVDREAYDRTPAEVTRWPGGSTGEQVYREIQRLESFHRLAHHPRLVSLYGALYDAPVLVHPRTIARVMIPGAATAPTPAHQDFIHVQGSQQTMTAWIPLGDAPMELGGLEVLPGSHTDGVLSYRRASGAGEMEAYVCRAERGWVRTDYRAGDVITFTSQTVHRALPHRAGDRIRLSVDYRYQPAADPIDAGSLRPHMGVATWDEVYADWQHDDLQYFWRDDAPTVSPWDESIRWQQDRIC